MTDNHKKIKQAHQELEETKRIMESNFEKALAREKLLSKLDLKVKDLREHTQEFALKSNEFKLKSRTHHYFLLTMILFGALGSAAAISFGVLLDLNLAPMAAIAIAATAVGGFIGFHFGKVQAFFDKQWFKKKLNLNASFKPRFQSHHEKKKIAPLEISKSLTKWFEANKQIKPQQQVASKIPATIDSSKSKNSVKH